MRRLTLLLILLLPGLASADDGTGFGSVSIPNPDKPAAAEQCVEPVEIMRRDHMVFLDHQRDRTVIDGERGTQYSLTGCMDCHNPADAEKIVRYEDPEHFCAECHAYTGVRIDCFECHADRGLQQTQQSRLGVPWHSGQLSLGTLGQRAESADAD